MKNTMIGVVADMFCPLSCISCGVIGKLVCECCRKNMDLELRSCLYCGETLNGGICKTCDLPFSRQFCLGTRTGILKELINVYKYQSLRAGAAMIADLFLSSFNFEENDIIVPLPTIRKHIRERGYGHIEHLAKTIAKNSKARYETVLGRAKNTVQVGANAKKREAQANEAYFLKKQIDESKNYYLLDDVWTTGSSMLAAAKKLRSAGAQHVNAILIAKTV